MNVAVLTKLSCKWKAKFSNISEFVLGDFANKSMALREHHVTPLTNKGMSADVCSLNLTVH